MRRNRKLEVPAFAAGLLALLALAVGVYAAIAQQVPWKDDFEIKAVFKEANELGSRSPVRIAGVNVGSVTKVEKGPGNTALVTMKITDEGQPLRVDAQAKVRPRIFLEGNFFIDIQPGTPDAPAMKENATIPVAQTATPVQLDQVLTGLERPSRQALTEVVSELAESSEDGGAEALQGTLRLLGPALIPAAQSAEAVRGERPGDLAAGVRHSGLAAQAVGRGERLDDLVGGLAATTRALSAERRALSGSVRGLDEVLGEASPTLRSINEAIPPARAFTQEARPGLRAAPETLRLANPVLLEAQKLLGRRELPALLDQLEPAQRTLASLAPRLVQLFDQVTPVTECLRTNAVPTLKKPVEDPPHSSGEPVYRELLYGLTGLASASQNFDGNGPAVRYHAGAGDQVVTFGQAPSLTEPVVGLTSEPLLGSRPRYTAKLPPFRPDVPCGTQQPPDLAADTGPAPQQQTTSSTAATKTLALRKLPDLLERAGKRAGR